MSRSKSYKQKKQNGKSASSPQTKSNNMTPDQIKKHNDRKDLMDNRSDYSNDFRWYAKDPVIADQISQFSFNMIEGVTPLDGVVQPGVMRIALNPSLGTTPNRLQNGQFVLSADNQRIKGINIAAQKWWYTLTSRSGRGATYSKVDISMLFGAVGEVISTIEFCRRALGVALTYSTRNRLFPTGIWHAMGVDGDDLMANMSDYRMKLNVLVAKLNQLPIPGNIDYFNKCQNMYQKIFADGQSSMAQMYVFVPATSWVIDESSYPGGTVLRTIPMVWDCGEASRGIGRSSGTVVNQNVSYIESYLNANDGLKRIRKFSFYLDQLNTMINALLFSTTFSTIYSDMLNLVSTGHLSLWTFDLVKEDYVVQPEYDALALQQIHNMTFVGVVRGVEVSTFESKAQTPGYDYGQRYEFGTPSNDVYPDPDSDTVVYNPSFALVSGWSNNSGNFRDLYMGDLLVDSLVDNPGVDLRIDMTRYIAYINDRNGDFRDHNPGTLGALSLDEYLVVTDMILPDHYALAGEVFSDNSGIPTITVCNRPFSFGPSGINTNDVEGLSRFDWRPLIHLTMISTSPEGTRPKPVYGDLNFYCTLEPDWMSRVTDMVYLNLFDVG